jgi:Ca2+-binding RTX toxin-like protein
VKREATLAELLLAEPVEVLGRDAADEDVWLWLRVQELGDVTPGPPSQVFGEVDGRGGNDELIGGRGADSIVGGDGIDVDHAGRGADFVDVRGDGSRDFVYCGRGFDTVSNMPGPGPADSFAADCEEFVY